MKSQRLAFILSAFLIGCSTGDIDFGGLTGLFSNQGTIGSGTTSGNVQTMEIDLDLAYRMGGRKLTTKEKEVAKEAFKEGLKLVREKELNIQSLILSRVPIHYTAAGSKRWKGWGDSSLTFVQFLEKHPKAKEAHPDLQKLLRLIWEVHPTFVITECSRSLARSKKMMKTGKSWVSKPSSSRHTWTPAQACDIVSVRKTGRPDFQDVHAVALYQGIAMGIGDMLKDLPCNVFGSEVERTMDWDEIIDLWHQQNNVRKECRNQAI